MKTAKTQNELDYPKCAKMIKAFRISFPKLKVMYVRENGKEQGRQLTGKVTSVFTSSANLKPSNTTKMKRNTK